MSTGAALSFVSLPAGASQAKIGHLSVLRPILDWRSPHADVKMGVRNTLSTIKMWNHCFRDSRLAENYCDTLVGKNPFSTQAAPSTTIKATIIPVIIKFANGDTWDPTAIDSCDTASALTRTQNSPIFKSQPWSFGGTSVGNDQYIGAFQRAEFYKQTGPTGINPGYNVRLAVTTAAALTLNVPAADAATGTTVCGNGLLGAVDINWFDPTIESYITSTLGAAASTTFPIFLMDNVVLYEGTTSNCCILGYHSAMTNAGNFQTYGVSMYDNTGDFAGSADVSALSHEVAEWMNDPNTANPTAPWGHIGQVTGCQANFEVGDPLSGTVITDTFGGKTYHLQELAFYGWYYHHAPSGSINGWYSSEGTFTTSAAACS
jgi:hypothetical protein